MPIDIFSTEECPRCNGSGRKISAQSLKSLLTKSKKTQSDVASSMRITPQFLNDLLADRRDWTTKHVRSFLSALGKIVED